MTILKPIRAFTCVLFILLMCSLGVYNAKITLEKITSGFTNLQVQEVYQKLYVHSGLRSKPSLIILNSSIINAWTDGEQVTITTGLLNIMKTQDEVALVLGHELGHIINYDILHDAMEQYLKVPLNQSYKEASADKVGAFIMMRAGFDICKGSVIMKTFRDNFGSDAAADGHPDNAFRVDELNLPQCN